MYEDKHPLSNRTRKVKINKINIKQININKISWPTEVHHLGGKDVGGGVFFFGKFLFWEKTLTSKYVGSMLNTINIHNGCNFCLICEQFVIFLPFSFET